MQNPTKQHLLQKYIAQYQLSQHLNENLLRCLRVVQFSEQQPVYIADTEQHALYFLVDGKAQVNYYLANGKRSILTLITPFSVIGDIELFEDMLLQLNVTTTETSTFLAIDKTDVMHYGYNDPIFLRFLLHHMGRKLQGSGYTQVASDLPLINRLAIYLLAQATDENGHLIPETKPLIADLIGTTPRHLNRVIKALEDNTVLHWGKDHIRILNQEKLQAYSEI